MAQPPNVPAYGPLNPPLPPSYSAPVSDDDKKTYAFQYYGYPALSQWMGSSGDFFLLRRFKTLSARSLLFLQNEIAKREKELEEEDQKYTTLPMGRGHNGSFKDQGPERSKLMGEITRLLEEYYSFVNALSKIKETPTANEHQIRNLQHWQESYPNAIIKHERHFFDVEKQGDLFPIVAKIKTPIGLGLEKLRGVRSIFNLKKRPGRIQSLDTQYHSGTGLDILAGMVIVLFGLAFILGPLWWLEYVDSSASKLKVITGWICVFAVWLWFAAGPKGFEILAGVAAYSAVLMVFLQVQTNRIAQ